MLHTTSSQPRVHWWLLGVSVVALAITVIVGILEIIPDESSSGSASFALGAFVSGVIMVVALVVFIGSIMFVLGEFLRSEEHAERAYATVASRQGGNGAHAAEAAPFVVSRRESEPEPDPRPVGRQ